MAQVMPQTLSRCSVAAGDAFAADGGFPPAD
jgi:hypothetical protein